MVRDEQQRDEDRRESERDRREVDRKDGDRRDVDRRDLSRRSGARQPRLDLPLESRRSMPRPHYDPETFGRFAETFARFMGTGRFLLYMTVFIICWITLNVVLVGALQWDAYPFILLNLIFSTQASYAAPLILLAQNRQEARDRVVTEQDRDANARSHADMEYLAREVAALRMAIGEVATRDFLRSELRSLVADSLGAGESGPSSYDDNADSAKNPRRTAGKWLDKSGRRQRASRSSGEGAGSGDSAASP